MTTEHTRETMQHYVEALLSSGDFARYFADDVVFDLMGTNQPVQGREPVRQTIAYFHEQAFRTAIEVKSVVCDGGRAAVEAEFVGTHIGDFQGIAASQRDVRLPYTVAYDVAEQGIRQLRVYFPLGELMRQIS